MHQSEFTIIKSRVLIVGQYHPKYAEHLTKSLDYSTDDPRSALFNSRTVLEAISKELWEKYDDKPFSSVYEAFQHPEIKDVIPKRIINRMHSCRTICNMAVHGEHVRTDDAWMALNHLFVILEWFGIEYEEKPPLPETVEPPLPFNDYLNAGFKNGLLLPLLVAFTILPATLFSFHRDLPKEFSRPFLYLYEGIFLKFEFSLFYSAFLVIISLLLSWWIFKRFRKQDGSSSIVAFILMYVLVFSVQFLVLSFLDFFTSWF